MSNSMQKSFKEMLFTLVEYKKKVQVESDEPFYTSDYLDAEKVFLNEFVGDEIVLSKDDIEVQEGALSLDEDAVPYIKFNINIKKIDMCVQLVAYHHSSWDFYLDI